VLKKNANATEVEITDFQTGLSLTTNTSDCHKLPLAAYRNAPPSALSAAVAPKVGSNLSSADCGQSRDPAKETLKRLKGMNWSGQLTSAALTAYS
jgi:hypothetical protein